MGLDIKKINDEMQRQYRFLDNQISELNYKINELAREMKTNMDSSLFFENWLTLIPNEGEKREYLSQIITNRKKFHIDHEKQLNDLKNELILIQKWKDQYIPCPNCVGHGKFRIWEAQDDSYLEDCEKCKGNGFLLTPISGTLIFF